MTHDFEKDKILAMVSDMEDVEKLVGNKGRFVCGMVHIPIKDWMNCMSCGASVVKDFNDGKGDMTKQMIEWWNSTPRQPPRWRVSDDYPL